MGSHYRGSERQLRALNAYIKLMRASNSITDRIHAHLAVENLTASQFGTLEMLHHLGPLFQKDIAKKLLKTGGNITMVIGNLEKRNLVRRERSENDRRYIRIRLTDEGKQLIQRIFPRHVTAIVEEMSQISDSEQEELGRICRKLGIKK